MPFIYKYETSTLTPFVKPHNILNLAAQNIFYVQSYVESNFTYNLGSNPTIRQSEKDKLKPRRSSISFY